MYAMKMTRDKYRRPSWNPSFLVTTFFVIVFTAMDCFRLPLSQAFSDVIVTNTSLITDCCIDFCGSYQLDRDRTKECQRGCRIFGALNQASVFVPFDDVHALTNCHSSCSEAYENDLMAEMACSDGCIQAQQEYHKIYSLSLQWLQEIQSNMTFFETLLEVTGAIVFPPALGVDASRFLEHSPGHHNLSRNILKTKLPHRTTTSTLVTQQPSRTPENWNPSPPKQLSNIIPNWIAQGAFIILTLGVFAIVGVCCYCCIVAHLIKNSRRNAIILTDDVPPSYDQLVRGGLIVSCPSTITNLSAKRHKPETSDGEADPVVDSPLLESEEFPENHRHLHQVIVV